MSKVKRCSRMNWRHLFTVEVRFFFSLPGLCCSSHWVFPVSRSLTLILGLWNVRGMKVGWLIHSSEWVSESRESDRPASTSGSHSMLKPHGCWAANNCCGGGFVQLHSEQYASQDTWSPGDGLLMADYWPGASYPAFCSSSTSSSFTRCHSHTRWELTGAAQTHTLKMSNWCGCVSSWTAQLWPDNLNRLPANHTGRSGFLSEIE